VTGQQDRPRSKPDAPWHGGQRNMETKLPTIGSVHKSPSPGLLERARRAVPPRRGGLNPWRWLQGLLTRRSGGDLPAELLQSVNLGVLNCRVRIGREAKGEDFQSVLVVDICGTIRDPRDAHEVALQIVLHDVTDSASEPLSVLNRPKYGPLNPASCFVFQSDMGKLCHSTTVLEDWAAVGQLSPDRFVLPRQGPRKLRCSVSILSKETGDVLAMAACESLYENLEIGYLEIEENIQRTKTLAVGLAFSVGAANGELLEPEVNVIQAWVTSNFSPTGASPEVRQELERAIQKTASFFRRNGWLNVQEVCQEVMGIAPLVGRLEIIDLCLRVAAAKGKVGVPELTILKDLSDWLGIDRNRLRAMMEKVLPVEMHQSHDAEMVLGVTDEMSMEEARRQLNREYAKWSSRVISSDPAIRRQADQMIRLIADARTQYVGAKPSE
jgi:hypothetical protein